MRKIHEIVYISSDIGCPVKVIYENDNKEIMYDHFKNHKDVVNFIAHQNLKTTPEMDLYLMPYMFGNE
jgi:hypothetical protein